MKAAWAAALALTVVTAAAVTVAAVTSSSPARPVTPVMPGSPCGQTSARRPAIRHVLIVMLENRSSDQVIGRPAGRYQTRLAAECGNATEAFGATHGSGSDRSEEHTSELQSLV